MWSCASWRSLRGPEVAGRPRHVRVELAKRTKWCVPGLCLNRVRRWCGVPARYASARKAWQAIPASRRHTDLAACPRGVPVWLDKPSSRFGHITLSMGHDAAGHLLVRSTDYPRRGRVSTVRADELADAWGMRVIGWATSLNGRDV